MNLDSSIVANRGLSKISNCMANIVDPDETAHYELSHLDLHYLQRNLYWYGGMKGLNYVISKTGQNHAMMNHVIKRFLYTFNSRRAAIARAMSGKGVFGAGVNKKDPD